MYICSFNIACVIRELQVYLMFFKSFEKRSAQQKFVYVYSDYEAVVF